MDFHRLTGLVAVVVALTLIGAPLTMADWSEQAVFSTNPIEKSQVDGEIPILQYESLPSDAQTAVRRVIESPDGSYTVYGSAEIPERFFYSDFAAPGQGLYVIHYQGQYYELHTFAGGSSTFVYWLFEIPFIIYGLVLAWIAYLTYRGRYSPRTTVLATVPGLAFHVLGPAFDFPVIAPMQFVGLGVLVTCVVVVGLVWDARQKPTATAE